MIHYEIETCIQIKDLVDTRDTDDTGDNNNTDDTCTINTEDDLEENYDTKRQRRVNFDNEVTCYYYDYKPITIMHYALNYIKRSWSRDIFKKLR